MRAHDGPAAGAATGARAGLRTMLEARSVAVVGASARPSSPGDQMMRQLLHGGFDGRVAPVNPRYDEIHGRECHATLADVPEARLPDGDPVHLPAVLAQAFGMSTSEARRLIAQGGVRVDGDVVDALDVPAERLDGALVQAGKRRFARVRAGEPAAS